MPTISSFYGIVIIMYLRDKEHNPPHIHAVTPDYYVPFSIISGELMEGTFPPKARMMVKEFILKNQRELMKMWEEGDYHKIPPLT